MVERAPALPQKVTNEIIRHISPENTTPPSLESKENPPATMFARVRETLALIGEVRPDSTPKEVAEAQTSIIASLDVMRLAAESYHQNKLKEQGTTEKIKRENSIEKWSDRTRMIGRAVGALFVGVFEGVAVASVVGINNILKRIEGSTAVIALGATGGALTIALLEPTHPGLTYITQLISPNPIISRVAAGAMAGATVVAGSKVLKSVLFAKSENTDKSHAAQKEQNERNSRKRK